MTTEMHKSEKAWTKPTEVEFVRVLDSNVEWIADTWAGGTQLQVHTVTLPGSDQELRMIKIDRGEDGWEYVPENGVIVRHHTGTYSAYTPGEFFELFSLTRFGHKPGYRSPRESGIEMTIVPTIGQAGVDVIAGEVGRMTRGSVKPSETDSSARELNDAEPGEGARLVRVLRDAGVSEVNIRKALAKGL